MGWAEGQGLGRENKGIVKHIWTKKRNDQVGLGGEVGNDWGAHSIQTNTYNSLLSKLAVITNNSDSDSDTDSGSDSEPAAKASASKRKKQGQTGKKKGRASDCGASSEEESDKTKKLGKKKSKKAKREASSDSDSSDEDLSKAASASCDDYGGAKGRGGRSYAAAAAKEAKEKKEAAKVSTSSLRYAYKRSQMNRTKDVKSYSATDLSQILGFSVAPKEEDKSLLARDGVKKHARAGSASSADSSSDSDKDSDADETRAVNKRKQENKGAAEGKAERKKGIVIGSQARKPMVLPPPTVLTGVLSHMFCNGGFLSGEPQKQKEQDWQFDEATQEKIAVDAHENKAAGKKGLGFSSDRPSKLGKDYKGSKKRFDDEDEDEEAVGSNKVDRESDWGSKQKLSTSSGDEEEEENKEERKRRRKAEKKAKKAAEAAAAVDVEVEVEESEEERKKRRKAEKKAKRKAAAEQEESEMNGKKKKKKKQ